MKNIDKNFKQERTRIYDDNRNDSYRAVKKFPDPTVCNACGALFTNGRWTWDDIPKQVSYAHCPACQRINDQYPAGIITVEGSFFHDNHSMIMNMIKNINSKEISEHPLERIMDIKKQEERTVITTTGLHLARRIGDALYNAYEGDLNYNYDDENLIRVSWKRQALKNTDKPLQ